MSLNNSQYNSIIRAYEEKQRKSRIELDQRTDEIYAKIPAYEELAKQVSSVSIQHSKKMLMGDTSALDSLKQELRSLALQKKELLKSYGFPADYLEPQYECVKCKDTGYVNGEKCICFRKAEIDMLYEQSNLKNLLKTENFGNLSYDYYVGQGLQDYKEAVAFCRKFIENFGNDYQNLLLYGKVGRGKSFLSCCVAKELIDQGKLVLYFSATQLFDILSKITFDKNSAEAASGIYEDIYSCDLLIIDDLGTEVPNNFTVSQLFSCLNIRHLRCKPTIITTNLSIREIRNNYSERIFSRITNNFKVYMLDATDDIRLQKRRQTSK